jgi:undecaprenyl-diphosphatase
MDEIPSVREDDPADPPARAGEPAAAAGQAAAARAWWRSPWLVPGGLVLVLVLLTVNVLADSPLVGADQRIRAAVQARATAPAWRWLRDSWHAPAQLLVDLGNYQVAVPVLAACALIAAARRRTPRPLLAAFAGVVLLLVTVTAAKIAIGRTGPGLTTLGSGGLGVFPSGHTTTATVCLGLAVLLLFPSRPASSALSSRPATPARPARAGRAAVIAVAVVCLLVGAALVWCDYHWFTDVMAGWALAVLIIQAALLLSRLTWRPPPWSMPRWGRGRG